MSQQNSAEPQIQTQELLLAWCPGSGMSPCLGSFVSARLKSQQVPPGTVCMQHLCGMHSESSIHAAAHLPYLSLFTHLWVPQAEISDKLAEALSSGDSGLKRYFFKKITGMFSIKLSRMTCVNLRVRCYVWTARWWGLLPAALETVQEWLWQPGCWLMSYGEASHWAHWQPTKNYTT